MMPIVMRLAGSASAVGSWVFRAQLRAALFVAVTGSLFASQIASASSTDAEYVVSDMPASPAPAADNAFINGIRAQDEIILVNVRPLGGCCIPEMLADSLHVESYQDPDGDGCRQWQAASMSLLQNADSSIPTVVFVHGNRITPGDAKREGVQVYRRIVRNATSAQPIRFVIFSWPSAQIPGPLKDVRVKAARTRPAGCQLAWVLDQMPADAPVTLIGFSYGARIISGALHIVGGGSLGGMGLADGHASRRPVNAIYLAAAMDSDWLCPGHYHGLAMSQTNHLLLVDNCDDRAMRFYRFSTTCGDPQALGLCGPTCLDADGASKTTKRDVSRYVGTDHNLFAYMCAPGVASQCWHYSVDAQ
jgi:hypothetical protein